MADSFDPAKLFHINMKQFPGGVPFVADHRRRRIERGQSRQACSAQNPSNRRGTATHALGYLTACQTLAPPQLDDHGLLPRFDTAGPVWPRGPIMKAFL